MLIQLLFCVLVFYVGPSLSLREAQVGNPISYGSIGSKETLICKAENPISICAWKLSTFDNPNLVIKYRDIRLDYHNHNTKDDFENGICKLHFENIDETNFGFWNCTLIDERGPVETFHSVIELRPSKKVQQIEIIDKDKFNVIHLYEEQKKFIFKCCASGGAPSPVLSFFKGLNQSHYILEEKLPLSNVTTEKEKVCIEWSGELKWSDHGKDLVCYVESHSASEIDRVKDVLPINLTYAPIFLDEEKIFLVSQNEDGIAKFEITGNPIFDTAIMIEESEGIMREISHNEDKYKVNATFIKNNLMEMELRIYDFEEQDTRQTFLLKACNMYGEKKLEFKFQFSDVSDSYSLWVLISLGIALLVVIAIVVFILYNAKICCFRRRRKFSLKGYAGVSSTRNPPTELFDGGSCSVELNRANKAVLLSSYKEPSPGKSTV